MAEKQSNKDRLKEITDSIEMVLKSCLKAKSTRIIFAP